MKPNIDHKGRLYRIIGGTVLILSGLAVLFFVPRPWPWPALGGAIACGVGGGFMLFEAFNRWCALRACGIKTPL